MFRDLTVYKVRYIFGISILLIQVVSIGLYIVLGLRFQTGSNALADVLAGAGILAPLTTTYGLTFFRFVVANGVAKQRDSRRKFQDIASFWVQWCVILLFGFTLIALEFYLFRNEMVVGGHENIKVVVAAVETLFGAYLALIFSTLFPMEWESPRRN